MRQTAILLTALVLFTSNAGAQVINASFIPPVQRSGASSIPISAEKSVVAASVVAGTFKGTIRDNKTVFQWQVAGNEMVDRFEVERGNNGIDFSTMGLIFTSETTGTEDYKFKNIPGKKAFRYYRIKIVSKNNTATYSETISL